VSGADAPWQSLPLAANAAAGGRRRIFKSRYSSISAFISEDEERLPDAYNDVELEIDAATFDMCRAGGVDARLARHVAHLFIRDPLVIFREKIEQLDDRRSVEHFENVQSTNWRSMRWKPPPADAPSIGWRVELRTMEVQITDFENAAFTVFVVLLSRVCLFFDMNLYIRECRAPCASATHTPPNRRPPRPSVRLSCLPAQP
jgi:glutamate--cysteine ligase catalytic subunit